MGCNCLKARATLRGQFTFYHVYTKLVDDISLLNFEIVVAKCLVGRYSNHNRSFFTARLSKSLKNHP